MQARDATLSTGARRFGAILASAARLVGRRSGGDAGAGAAAAREAPSRGAGGLPPWRAACLCALAALPAAAQDATPLSAEEHSEWTAIGRVNVGGLASRGACTGALVAPDLVLTAAHCVPPRALREESPEKVHFVAGWFRDGYAAHRTARRVYVHPEYQRGRRDTERLYSDIALLELSEPIPREVAAPLEIGEMPGFADDVEIVAYSNRRPGALSREGPCVSIQLSPDLLGTTCTAISGNSGAPVLRPGEDGWSLVALVVATSTGPGGFRSFAARPADVLFELAGREVP